MLLDRSRSLLVGNALLGLTTSITTHYQLTTTALILIFQILHTTAHFLLMLLPFS